MHTLAVAGPEAAAAAVAAAVVVAAVAAASAASDAAVAAAAASEGSPVEWGGAPPHMFRQAAATAFLDALAAVAQRSATRIALSHASARFSQKPAVP